MKQLFAYIRVSTAKQGLGVSLQEQRAAIERYAARTGAEIIEWFEEQRTAAKAGRPEFTRLVKLLREGAATGVVIHKIDRSTRNYRDWAEIDELIDSGIEVHFANDDLDLRSRGGRLAADIQMVVAVDYIRNLREEALKGIHGRLKQGILPCSAPIGYLNCGAGKPKVIDPMKGPLVRMLFERYATGDCTLRVLTNNATNIGLRNRNGNVIRLPQIHKILRNPFYVGVIRSSKNGLFPGAHTPLLGRPLFDRVQQVLDGKLIRRTKRFRYAFRRLLRCKTCGRSLVGSMAKGRVYYRCQTIDCPTTSVREDAVDSAFRDEFHRITFNSDEARLIENELSVRLADETTLRDARRAALQAAVGVTNARMSKLTDLLLDGKIDAPAHDEKRTALVMQRQKIEADIAGIDAGTAAIVQMAKQILELAKCAENLYESADEDQKRRLVEIAISNCLVIDKTLEFSLREPFATIARRSISQQGGPHWNTARTFNLDDLLSAADALPKETFKLIEKFCAEAPLEAVA